MNVGDLVRIINEWTVHNPWMKFDDDEEIGLIVNTPEVGNLVVKVLIGGKVLGYSKKVLEVVNESG